VDLVVHLVQVAVRLDRDQQREILAKVQAKLPALGALEHVDLPEIPLPGRA
jgi:hypothetical protein